MTADRQFRAVTLIADNCADNVHNGLCCAAVSSCPLTDIITSLKGAPRPAFRSAGRPPRRRRSANRPGPSDFSGRKPAAVSRGDGERRKRRTSGFARTECASGRGTARRRVCVSYLNTQRNRIVLSLDRRTTAKRSVRSIAIVNNNRSSSSTRDDPGEQKSFTFSKYFRDERALPEIRVFGFVWEKKKKKTLKINSVRRVITFLV